MDDIITVIFLNENKENGANRDGAEQLKGVPLSSVKFTSYPDFRRAFFSARRNRKGTLKPSASALSACSAANS